MEGDLMVIGTMQQGRKVVVVSDHGAHAMAKITLEQLEAVELLDPEDLENERFWEEEFNKRQIQIKEIQEKSSHWRAHLQQKRKDLEKRWKNLEKRREERISFYESHLNNNQNNSSSTDETSRT